MLPFELSGFIITMAFNGRTLSFTELTSEPLSYCRILFAVLVCLFVFLLMKFLKVVYSNVISDDGIAFSGACAGFKFH